MSFTDDVVMSKPEKRAIFALEEEHFLFPFQTVTPESARPA